MKVLHSFLLFGVLMSILAICTTQDTITVDQVIRDGDTLVSADKLYELGFFSPGSSRNRYLGICYKNISPQTVVWVANRETPIKDSSGVFRVHPNGSLLVIIGSNNTTVWSSETSLISPITIAPVAQLLSSGNLVVRGNGEGSFIWQSFDYPGDTFLPGMKLGKDFVSGNNRRWRPWKSLNDPSPGEYVTCMNTEGFPQLFFEEKDSVQIARFGPWNGVTFNGMPNHTPNSIITHEFVFNDKEVFYRYALVNNSVLTRVYMNPEGSMIRLNWVNRTQEWLTYWNVNIDMCSWFRCGPNGRCNPTKSPACSCMEGFEPQNPDEWSASEWSSGCRRRTPLDCPNADGFRAFKNVQLPDTRRSWYNRRMTLGECETACKSNCSCTAYANIDITRGGSGCLLWFGDLLDVRAVVESQDLYVRMALSDLTFQESTSKPSSNKKRIVIVAVSISSSLVTMMLILSIVYAWNKTTRDRVRKLDEPVQVIDEEHGMESQNDDDDTELSYFSLTKISKCTMDFSNDNKLGEGGFGPVYMGVLDDGREIAVKRLSKTSRQGINEFKNELNFIAKLQHRNLVKLLGYCNEGDENMLIYEYMRNRSLDLFIFGTI